jgi:hypothetical protein
MISKDGILGQALTCDLVLVAAVRRLGSLGSWSRTAWASSSCVEKSEQSRSPPLLASKGPEEEGGCSAFFEPASHPPPIPLLLSFC